MAYFDQRFFEFFGGLALDNSKAYFDENRQVYVEAVREPFKELVGDLIIRVREHEHELDQEPRDAVFRINRDIRFTKDKRPYKDHVGAHISRWGRRDMEHPGLYVHLSPEKVMIAGGSYRPSPQGAQRIRSHIAGNLEHFASIIGEPPFKERFGEVRGDRYKRVPKEFEEVHRTQPLVANKQFYFQADHEPDAIVSEGLLGLLMDHYEAARPFSVFLEEALKG